MLRKSAFISVCQGSRFRYHQRTAAILQEFGEDGLKLAEKYGDDLARIIDNLEPTEAKKAVSLINSYGDDALEMFKEGKSFNKVKNVVESGRKVISYTEYDNIYQSSIHNAGKEKVMLGKYDGGDPTSYITKAGDDYTYFSLGNEWDTIKTKYGYTDDEMFKLFNEAFLDDGINEGKTFQFSHNPINDTGALGKEYQYLLKNNYKWDAETMTMKP